jgi:hypothetical protein
MLLAQSDQSHTLLRNEAMLTRLDLISNIHGCSSIRQGVARRLGSFSRLLHPSQHGLSNRIALTCTR